MYKNRAPYKKLFTYWFSVIIYDLTVQFTKDYIRSYKLSDQMDGAARSGKQNIVEGSDAMRVSVKSAIKLTGVAKASIEELIGDYEDYLRQRGLGQWNKSDRRIRRFRAMNARIVRNLSNLGNLRLLDEYSHLKDSEESANRLLTLCHQATYLLSRQIDALECKHAKEGGYTEKLYRKRMEYRRETREGS